MINVFYSGELVTYKKTYNSEEVFCILLRHAFSDDDFSSVNQQIYGGFAIHGVTKSAFYTIHSELLRINEHFTPDILKF